MKITSEKNILNKTTVEVKTFVSVDALINQEELGYYNERNNKLHFTNFGTKKVNQKEKNILYGKLCNSLDLANYLNIDIERVNKTILDVCTDSTLKMNNLNIYNTAIDKSIPLKNSWRGWAEENFKYNTDSSNPDNVFPIIWLNELNANRVIRVLRNEVI